MFDLFDLLYLRPTGMRVYVHIYVCVSCTHVHTCMQVHVCLLLSTRYALY